MKNKSSENRVASSEHASARRATPPQSLITSHQSLALLCSAPGESERAVAFLKAARPLPVLAAADDAPLPKEIVWMPAGTHEICAHMLGGGTWEGTVVCDAAGAAAIQQSFLESMAEGQRVWIDCLHDDGEAAAWVKGFSWDPTRGIVAQVEWTGLGEKALRERRLYTFSPAFFTNKATGRVASLIYGHAAGGLVNAPAFGASMPALIAARLGGTKPTDNPPAAQPGTENSKAMKKELLLKILAALGVKPAADATDEQLTALVAEHADKVKPTDHSAELTALKAQLNELKAAAPKPDDVAAIKAELDALKTQAAAAKTKRASDAVAAAVARGALKAEDKATQASWQKIIEADESHVQLLAALPGTPKPETPETVIIGDAVLAAKNRGATEIQITQIGLVEGLKAWAGCKDAALRNRIYVDEVHARLGGHKLGRLPMGERLRCKNAGDLTGGVMLGPILAANSLGTLAPELIVQRSLTLLKLTFPMLSFFTTDFSDQPALGGAAIITRTRAIPSVSQRNSSTGYVTTINASTTDVPVTLAEQPYYVQMAFNTAEMSATNRDLFGEQVEGCHYAIGKDLCDAIYAVITPANFANETVIALNSFNRNGMTSQAKALTARGVPKMGRFSLLSQDYFEKLSQDSTIMQLAAFREPELIHEYGLPRIAGMQPFEAVNLPTDDSLQGFSGTQDSLVVVTRPPANYNTALPGGGNGTVQTVTNPDIGLSAQLAMFVNHVQGEAVWRLAYMRGQAKGQAASGQRLVDTATSS